ncbi:synaptic vesicle glycoprotein 2B-like [Diorhabda sublineata]|uniref:synaptic vesicle glycoprotein 2B-like n=1 Tax=Diorhabda sublineata TaxID=1163346 RepID=UPI0024E08A12|nr:synaptic vesicle glycoprotein 2B-like [Diorhabda sublineata]
MDESKNKISLRTIKLIEGEDDRLYNSNQDVPRTFEEAITATGFGKYNYILLLVILFPCTVIMTETVGVNYIVPMAECDLNLSLEDKGILNGAIFIGMITSGLFWGYLCDALGRKKIIVYGYLFTGLFSLVAALSASKEVLIVSKFMSGLILNGPYSATTSHITEFHSSKYRGTVHMIRGTFFSVINLCLPIMAWGILPRQINISVFGYFVLKSWNVFMLVCASFPIISGLLYMFLPESPKFLMTMGKNREALAVMQNVYAVNSRKTKEDFPVKTLVKEANMNMSTSRIELATALSNGWSEMKTILKRPHISNMMLASFNAFSLVISLNTYKFWLPSIFQAISDYQNSHNGTSSSMCVMLEELKETNVTSTQSCSVDLNNFSVYLNTFIVASARVVVFLCAGTLVRVVGLKKLNIILIFICSSSLFCVYFARSSQVVTALTAVGTAIGSVPENLLVTITLELFPTSLRTIALSIHLTAQRTGTVVGNLFFPYLMQLGCLPPFLFIGIFSAACGIFSFLYADVENKPLR